MSTTYQSMVVLCVASFFVVVIWYIDKELKSVHTNIKIIQNMLKTIISNQNFLNEQPYKNDNYIPYEENTLENNNKDEYKSGIENVQELIPNKVIKNTVIEHEGIENEDIENEGIEHEGIENEGIEHEDIENTVIEHEGIENEGIENEGIEHEDIENTVIEHEDIENTVIEENIPIVKEKKKRTYRKKAQPGITV